MVYYWQFYYTRIKLYKIKTTTEQVKKVIGKSYNFYGFYFEVKMALYHFVNVGHLYLNSQIIHCYPKKNWLKNNIGIGDYRC